MKLLPCFSVPCLLAGMLGAAPAVRAQLVISEFLASNSGGLEDEDGDEPDWIEILNTSAAEQDLAGWSLSDQSRNPGLWTFPAVRVGAGQRLVVFASGKNRREPGRPLHASFRLSADGEYLALHRPDGSMAHGFTPAFPPQLTNVSCGLPESGTEVMLSPETAAARYLVPAGPALGLTWTAAEYDDQHWNSAPQGVGFETVPSEFAPYLSPAGNLLGTYYGRNASLYTRIAFDLPPGMVFTQLRLRARYDDGLVAWLNGVEVADASAPDADPLPWNAGATAERPDSLCIIPVEFRLDGELGRLRPGRNVLAVQLLNRSAGGADALLQTELIGVATTVNTAGPPQYFRQPSPGAPNGQGISNPGPVIMEETTAAPRPAPGPVTIPVSARILPVFSPLAEVSVRYRVMHSPEVAVGLRDDGSGNDAMAGDGVFSGTITTTLTAGQMLRWRFVATDSSGAVSTSPPFPDPLDSPQYWGTAATDPALAGSRLPAFEWFVAPGTNPDTDNGARISVMYLGEFYDNIEARLRGRSTRSFPKKGHNLDFNRGARFRWSPASGRVKDIDLITNWADKSRVRLSVAYEMARRSGLPAHFAFPVRVQRNAAFHGIFDMIEDGDDRYLERAGLDPEGALYKFKEYNHLRAPVSGYVKKTRTDEPDTDLRDLVAAIAVSRPLAERRRYAYDFLDLPAVVNYHAFCALVGHRDQGAKNFYVFHDSNRTRRWQFLPWDLDLTLGHTFTYSGNTTWGASYSGQGYYDDDIDSQQILRLGWDNPIKQILWNVPEFNAMFVRRLRTLADQFIGPPSAPSPWLPDRIRSLLDEIDPPGATGLTDAELDFRKWGFWVDGSGAVIPSGDARAPLHRMRAQAARITDANAPGHPGSAEYLPFFPVDSVPLPVRNLDSRPAWLPGRRSFLYSPGMARSGSLGVPESQVLTQGSLEITEAEVNPSTGQDQEYFVIRNKGTEPLDLSGCTVSGAIDFEFPAGCVIPAAAAAPVGLLHVAREIASFRNRTSGPRGGEFRLLTGGYEGQLSARGETIRMHAPDGTLLLSHVLPANPTSLQQALRISAILYAPSAATPSELAMAPGADAEDFEWIEFLNTGTTTIDLSGAALTEGVGFRFPAGFLLEPGQRSVVVASAAAFRARYGAAPVVAGSFSGNLDNSGERLQLTDATGESVLCFRYDTDWSAAANARGHALLIRDPASTAWEAWDNPESWAPGQSAAGTPGQAEPPALAFPAWQRLHFSATQLADPAISGPLADPDGDGAANLVEYATAQAPTAGAADVVREIAIEDKSDRIQLSVRRDPMAVDAAVSFQRHDGSGWQEVIPDQLDLLPSEWRAWFLPSGSSAQFRLVVRMP